MSNDTSSNPQEQKLTIQCPRCYRYNVFDQPYLYHAGFSDQGFLYSDSGHCTLVWSWYDPAIEKLFPGNGFSIQNPEARERFEKALRPAPDGGRWRFTNKAQCLYCSGPIGGTILEQIYYLVYPDSVITDENNRLGLATQLLL